MLQSPVPKHPTATDSTSALSTPPAPWTDRDFAIRQRTNATSVPLQTIGEANVTPDRSDVALIQDISRRIETSLGSDARDLTVAVQDAGVTLEGPVRDRYTKEVVTSIVDACPGVRAVDNRLRVDWIDETPSSERASSASGPPAEGDYLKSTVGSPTTTQRRTEN